MTKVSRRSILMFAWTITILLFSYNLGYVEVSHVSQKPYRVD